MVHDRFEFDMPASAEVVFDTFHYHQWRHRWDSLVNDTHVIGGELCPSVGAVSENAGGGIVRAFSMTTKFVAYDRPKLAAAMMIGRSIPFTSWAASMKHRAINDQQSLMVYTYTFQAGPSMLSWAIEPIVKVIFDWQTRKRFARMQRFLSTNAHEIQQWQMQRPEPVSFEFSRR